MPFDVSEEQNLLTSMLSERDAQISTLTHQLHSTSEVLHTTQKELQSKSASRKAQREEHSTTIKKLKEEHSEQRHILAKFEANVKNGGGLRVHEYAALMRNANSNQVESSYVIRLQAQLCRAMHSLGVMESQLALVKENCSSLIKFMREDLSLMVDDRTRREIELMNQLAKVDNEKRIMANEMEEKIQEKEDLLDQVREEYEELGLEYDENEVKRALEVKYLLEQMEKVKEDKIRLEKELLAALVEREEQINTLKQETQELGDQLEVLEDEAEKREREYNIRRAEEEEEANKEASAAEGDGDDTEEGMVQEDLGEATEGEDGGSDREGDKVEDDANEEEDTATNSKEEDTVSEVTEKLEDTVIQDDAEGSANNSNSVEEDQTTDTGDDVKEETGDVEEISEEEVESTDVSPTEAADDKAVESEVRVTSDEQEHLEEDKSTEDVEEISDS